ncbi:peptidase C39 family protein [Deinococcus ruber]|uniref:Peptidase C39 n=1 Tax=Deinococcus ruber TaxID=1848197 RepID=A0A918CEC8_9DEIO|nr:peptidase C39 family protein [Deinococcus ruber]GGR21077.1 peptidase C39 [Deinococcus ruber]
MLLTSVASAAPYAQQSSFGRPSPAILAAQVDSGIAATWHTLPGIQGDRLNGAPVKVPPFNELIPSWNVAPSASGMVQMAVRVQRPDGRWTPYFSFGTWRAGSERGSSAVKRTPDGTVNTDTLTLPFRSTAFQYRVTLGEGASVTLLSFNTSDTALRLRTAGVSGRTALWGKLLQVPRLSQMIYPNGGEIWCSPTSVSMILAFWQRPVLVPGAAKATYDPVYDGFGNWPFNTAYASTQGLQAFVTRLESLRDAEAYLHQGLPLAVSVRFKPGELPGAPIPSSTGHLMVLVGFDPQGNPVLNDPAAASNGDVQRVYPRNIFERLWLTHSGGMAYVIAPPP